MEAVACPVSHTVYSFVYIFLLAIVHCNEYPVWFEAFAFCLYRQYGPSLDSCICYCGLVSWRYCSFGSADPAPSHAQAMCRWGGCCGGLPYHPGSGPEWKLDWSACRPFLIVTTQTSFPALLWLVPSVQQTARSEAGSFALTPLD